MNFRILFLFFIVFILVADTAPALETIRFRHNGKERTEEGRIILEAQDGIAFESRDGQYYVVTPKNVLSRKSTDEPFVHYNKKEMIAILKEEFPPDQGYYFLEYDPFIVIYTTSRAFANWYGRLLEKLHEQYTSYWKRLGVKLNEPELPLVAIVFSNEEKFRQYAEREGTSLVKEQCAYYHKLSNRIAMYDMTGRQKFQEGSQKRANQDDIANFLSQPGSYHNVMTVIHEAVHQVGFNTGMHPRFAPNPIWVCEGLAVFHEVPDSKNKRIGWTLGPRVNVYRMEQLIPFLKRTNPQGRPIQEMIKNDKLFIKAETALDHYALAWGMVYFLVKKHPKEFADYLAILREKTPLSEDTGKIRLEEFESCFGKDWGSFYREFLDFLKKL